MIKKLMKYLPLLISFCLIATLGNSQIIKEKNAAERTVEGKFTSIEVSGGIDVYISQSSSQAVAVSAATPELRDNIVTEVKNGKLVIYFKTQDKLLQKFKDKDLKVFLSAPELSGIRAGGASDVIITGKLKGNELTIKMSGASDMKGAVEYDKINLEMSGASDVNLKGSVNKLEIVASGASDFNGRELKSLKCIAEASGASEIIIAVEQDLQPKASGASHIKYIGTPKTSGMSASGASKISSVNK